MMAHLFKRGRLWQAKVKLDEWQTERRISLGTTDKRVAQSRLEKRVTEFEKEAAGLLPSLSIREARERPLESLCEAFLSDVKDSVAAGTFDLYGTTLRVVRVRAGWTHLRHVTAAAFAEWRKHSGLRAKTANNYLATWTQFCGWLRRRRMLAENPLEFLDRVDTAKTAREYRRALTEAEGLRLIDTAPPKRAVIYQLILETGLRPGEVRRLRVADIITADEPGAGAKGAPVRQDTEVPAVAIVSRCDREPVAGDTLTRAVGINAHPAPTPSTAVRGVGPCVRVPASVAKNRKSALLPISAHLGTLLRGLIPADAPGFQLAFPKLVPKCPTFYRDLARAGIARVDDLGRRADMHALRKTFGTHLVLSGAEPRIVMEAMRHSDLKLTMKTYMDAAQLAGPMLAAVAKLPWNKRPVLSAEKTA